jgi:hypothetical protein
MMRLQYLVEEMFDAEGGRRVVKETWLEEQPVLSSSIMQIIAASLTIVSQEFIPFS